MDVSCWLRVNMTYRRTGVCAQPYTVMKNQLFQGVYAAERTSGRRRIIIARLQSLLQTFMPLQRGKRAPVA
jgi:hypothetical protein